MLTVVKKTQTDHVTPGTADRSTAQAGGVMTGHANIDMTHHQECAFSMSSYLY
jgi:hypothetical protein